MKKLFAALLAAMLVATAFCACLPVSAASTNLALGKTVTGADPTDGNQYTDKYNASLVDGIASDIFDGANAPGDWLSYYYNASLPSNAEMTDDGAVGEFTVDLGEKASVESVRIHMITSGAYSSSGIKAPISITAQYSTDNSSWSKLGEVTDFSSYQDIDWVEIDAGSKVDARYVKVTILYPDYTLMLNEVQVMGESSGAGDEPSDPPVNPAEFETFDLTAKDEATPEDANWYEDGVVVAITNDSSEEKTIASGEYALRYLFILVYDQNGVCVELGNNLLSADDEKAADYPQHDVKIPAGGFVILFYYNATEGPANQRLYDYYNDLGGAAYSNETGAVVSGKNYTAEIEGNTVTVYFTAPAGDPNTSSEAPSDESSEAPSEAVSSEAPSEAASSAPAASSSAASSAPAQTEDGGLSTGAIVGIVIGVVAVVAAAAVGIIVVRKKKS